MQKETVMAHAVPRVFLACGVMYALAAVSARAQDTTDAPPYPRTR